MGSTGSGAAETTATLTQLGSIDASDPKTHEDIIRKCQSVIRALQAPEELVFATLAGVAKFPCLVALSNLGVFEKLSAGPLTAAELAQQCGADRWLIIRLLRVAVAWEIIRETGPESYTATAASNLLASTSGAAGLRYSHFAGKVIDSLPAYLKQSEYRNPTSYSKGLFQHHHQTELGSFEWLSQPENKEVLSDFNLFMTIQRTRGEHWTENFNVKDRILGGPEVDPNVPLLVDIAGGFGQDLRLVKKELPDVVKGQLVLEDRDPVIDGVPADMRDEDFTYVKHNFFKPQPVQGARIYSFKGVLHDWPDDKALEILRQTASALTPGYSRIWILDGIVPVTGVDKLLSGLDICMMAMLGGLERTEEQWAQLLAQAGLKISEISILPDGFGLIEATLA